VDSVPAGTVCFSIQAAAEPGVMPRVLELFAKRNLVPERWVSGVHGPSDRGMADRGAELMIDLQVVGLTRQDRDYLARCLAQIADVRSVLTSEKAGA
jgi:acetolactate synthase small subunit